MTIVDFDPVTAVVGGVLVGLSATVLLATHGKIAGMSGMVARLFTSSAEERTWRAVFLLGLLAGAALCFALVPGADAFVVTDDPLRLVAAGLIVGFGTRLGGGCTSGHGVCGLAVGSRRSLVAVLSFMGAGFATVYVVAHVLTGGAA
ncbi:MAG: YeeE/YedE thiosulfate transporter family protein [Planctomycetota bacterium]